MWANREAAPAADSVELILKHGSLRPFGEHFLLFYTKSLCISNEVIDVTSDEITTSRGAKGINALAVLLITHSGPA